MNTLLEVAGLFVLAIAGLWFAVWLFGVVVSIVSWVVSVVITIAVLGLIAAGVYLLVTTLA